MKSQVRVIHLDMAHGLRINWLRGFRRIGWVVAFPITIVTVSEFSERGKELSPANYEARRNFEIRSEVAQDSFISDAEAAALEARPIAVKMPQFGTAHFSQDVPLEIQSAVVTDFISGTPTLISAKSATVLRDRGWRVIENKIEIPEHWEFTIYKSVSPLKIVGFGLLCFVVWSAVIQGSISTLGWIARGFFATTS
jgi:hypothetical protein